MSKFFTAIIFFLLNHLCISQASHHNLDSLKGVCEDKKVHDTLRCDALFKMATPYLSSNPDTAFKIGKTLFEFASQKKISKWIVNGYSIQGMSLYMQGNYNESLKYLTKALDLAKTKGTQVQVAIIYNNIGNVYKDQGNYLKCLDYYFAALNVHEKRNYKKGMAIVNANIGGVYYFIDNYQKALDHYFTASNFFTELDNKSGLALLKGNVGNIYYVEKDFLKALNYYKEAVSLCDTIGDLSGKARNLGNIGLVLAELGSFTEAVDFCNKAIKIDQELQDESGLAIRFKIIGEIYSKQKNFKKAEDYFEKALNISYKLNMLENISTAEKEISDIHVLNKNFSLAYEHYIKHIKARDSLLNQEKNDEITRLEMNYSFDKKSLADSIKGVERIIQEQLKHHQALKVQRTYTYGGVIAFALTLLIAAISFRAYKTKKRSNIIISQQKDEVEIQRNVAQHQKELVEEKQKEIIDSINYAQRIQRSLLANAKLLNDNLSDHFILFKPKDIVSGDFYWGAILANGQFALVTADSTGHGVPGAIMSMLNIACLNESLAKGLTSPNEILFETRKSIIEHLKNDGSNDGGKDGMDCSILCFDIQKKLLRCSAANNPIWIIRKNELIEIKPDKMPVGKHEKDTELFTLHEHELLSGDMIYALTDGYPDQFGGARGKKFMSKTLKEVLLNIAQLPLDEQKKKLNDTFNNWIGDLEQIDDVTIIGIRI